MAKDKEQGHEPSTFFYTFCATQVVVPVLAWLLRIKAKPDKEFLKAEGPIVILGNHPSYLDPINVMRLTKGRKVNFLAGEFLFRNKIWGYLFRKAGIIEIMQFTKDTSAVMGMMRVLKRKGVLVIFPEATRFVDGKSVKFDSGVAKFIKRAGAGIWFMEVNGAYLTYPRWSESFVRLGKIDARFRSHLTPSEVKEMSLDELQETIVRELDYNENDYMRSAKPCHKSRKLAAGLQNIAYSCQRCGGEFTMSFTGKDEIRCDKCGNRVRMLTSGLLEAPTKDDVTSEDLHQYTEWEKSVTRKQLEDPNFCLKIDCKLLRKYDAVDFSHVGNGVLTVTSDKFVYEDTDADPKGDIVIHKGKVKRSYRNKTIQNETPCRMEFDISEMKGLICEFGDHIELHGKDGTLFRFLIDGRKVLKLSEIVAIKGKLSIRA